MSNNRLKAKKAEKVKHCFMGDIDEVKMELTYDVHCMISYKISKIFLKYNLKSQHPIMTNISFSKSKGKILNIMNTILIPLPQPSPQEMLPTHTHHHVKPYLALRYKKQAPNHINIVFQVCLKRQTVFHAI